MNVGIGGAIRQRKAVRGWTQQSSHDVIRPSIERVEILRIDHIAIWTNDLERCATFYATYFGAVAGPHYVNATKGFRSCFLNFDGGARIEIMSTTRLQPVAVEPGAERMGLTHIAINVGSEEKVNQLTTRLREAGFAVQDGPRRTGDGYYESVVLDPDGNRVEIAA